MGDESSAEIDREDTVIHEIDAGARDDSLVFAFSVKRSSGLHVVFYVSGAFIIVVCAATIYTITRKDEKPAQVHFRNI